MPPAAWIVAFLEGSRHLDARVDRGADDVAWADLPGRDRTLVLGRTGRPFRARERRQLVVLARIGAVVDAADRPPAAGDPLTASEAVTDRPAFRADP